MTVSQTCKPSVIFIQCLNDTEENKIREEKERCGEEQETDEVGKVRLYITLTQASLGLNK